MNKFYWVVFVGVTVLLSACSVEEEQARLREEREQRLLDQQRKAMEKAKEVEKVLEEAAAKRRAIIDGEQP